VGDGTEAINLNNTGALILNAGVVLTAKGNVKWGGYNQTGIALDMLAGSQIVVDASGATIGSMGTNYSYRSIRATGTALARCSISTIGAGTNAVINEDGRSGNGWDTFEYTDFTRIGDATHPAHSGFYPGNRLADPTPEVPRSLRFHNCTFDNCGKIDGYRGFVEDNYGFEFDGCRITNCLNSPALSVNFNWDGVSAIPTRRISNSYIEGNVIAGGSMEVSDLVVRGSFAYPSGPFNGWQKSVTRVVFADLNMDGSLMACDITDVYNLVDSPGNPGNCYTLNWKAGDRNYTADGCIIQALGANVEGDAFFGYCSAVPGQILIKNTIILPDVTGLRASTNIISLGDGGFHNIALDHCTVFMGDGAATITIGEHITPPPRANTISALKNSIFYSCTAAYPLMNVLNDGSLPDNVATPGEIKNNCVYQLAPCSRPGYISNGTPYNLKLTGVAPGAADVAANPQFVDTTRNLLTWGSVVKGTNGSVEAALLALGENVLVNIPAMFAWVRAGWVPQNAALATAASDGTTIGAVQPGGPPPAGKPFQLVFDLADVPGATSVRFTVTTPTAQTLIATATVSPCEMTTTETGVFSVVAEYLLGGTVLAKTSEPMPLTIN
jgi:hypothetical protein